MRNNTKIERAMLDLVTYMSDTLAAPTKVFPEADRKSVAGWKARCAADPSSLWPFKVGTERAGSEARMSVRKEVEA
jgi:hypothetical protein